MDRFEAGIGGSYEDPWVPDCCDDCDVARDDCQGEDESCNRYKEWHEKRGSLPVQERPEDEAPMNEDRGIDEHFEREI